jgi:molybdenum cofactor synthesis domain-containing protein
MTNMPTKMRPIRETIPLDEARELIRQATHPIERRERVPLSSALGRVVSSPIVATQDVPPFARAAMDGYAVRAEDTFEASRYQPRVLACVEQVFTGQVPQRDVTTGTCSEIATGAPLPSGADAVLMVEETERDGSDRVRIFTPVYPRQNVGRQGADITAGQRVLEEGQVLNASRIGACAALGVADVEVFAKPRVAILSTGNEIVDHGSPLGPGQIYDVNKFTLSASVAEHGGIAVPYATAQDTLDELSRALDACAREDVIVFSGGSSVGERDLILDVLMDRGEVIFHGIAVKPGKPTVFGTLNGVPFFGMPGYPTSCLSNAYMLLAPAVRAIARLPEAAIRTVSVKVGQRIVSTTGRHQFFTVRIVDGVAWPAFKASGDITSMSLADGYIEIPAQTDIVEKDEMVEVKLF